MSKCVICCYLVGSTPLGMIGVSPPPHTLVMLAAKAQKAAQEMNEKRYENSSSNVRPPIEQVSSLSPHLIGNKH